MKLAITLTLLTFLLSCSSLAQAQDCNALQATQNFVDYVICLKYPVEVHTVTTEDGYKLTVFRIQAKNTKITEGKPVVLLQHGLLDSADGWIVNDEENAPGFILANKGYDIWFGNSRGNKYSIDHKALDPTNSEEYWKFSWMHMGQYDLPALFTYIAEKTGQKINYVGHSQGTTQMFAHLSNPDGKNKAITSNLRKFAALGPPTYMAHVSSKFFVTMAKVPYLPDALTYLFPYGIFHPNWVSTVGGSLLCKYMEWACANTITLIGDVDPSLDNLDRLSVIIKHYPGGTSVQNLHHWQQEIVGGGNFEKYDYGADLNQQIYGQSTPPKYDASLITEDVALFVGNGDELATAPDATKFYNEMTNAKKEIHYYDIGHLTFLIGKKLAYMDDLIKFLDIPQESETRYLRGISA